MGDSITRREFTLQSALALLAGTTISVAGCDSDSPTAPTNGTGQPAVITTISSNHGHTADLSTSDLTLTMLSLGIQGDSTHPHTVELSMEDLQAIADGTRRTVESSSDAGHTHSVTFELVS